MELPPILPPGSNPVNVRTHAQSLRADGSRSGRTAGEALDAVQGSLDVIQAALAQPLTYPNFPTAVDDGLVSRKSVAIATLRESAANHKGNHLDVTMAGAMGDNLADDTAAIQAALVTISAVGGGTLYFPQGTYLIQPTAAQAALIAGGGKSGILQLSDGTHLCGAGMGVSVIKLADSSGSYDAIFGPIGGTAPYGNYNNVHFSDLTIDQNGPNNDPPSLGNIQTHARVVLATSQSSTNLTVERVQVDNVKSVNCFICGAQNVVIRGCKFTNIGGGAIYHDHSTLYMSNTSAVIEGNQFIGRAFGAPGATTAIETHSGGHTITGNVIDTMWVGMNITGISALESVGVTVTGNIIKNGYYGIDLWSYIYTTHTTGYGLRDCIIANNTIRIAQNSWILGAGSGSTSLGNPLGIFLDSHSSLPFKGIVIKNNVIEFDLASYLVTFDGSTITASIAAAGKTITITGYTVSAADIGKTLWITGGTGFLMNQYAITAVNVGANTWTLASNVSAGAASGLTGFGADPFNNSGGGIVYWDADNNAANMFEDLTISGNTILNCPNVGVRISAQGQNLTIENNKIINPGSNTNRVAGGAAAYYSGIFVATNANDIKPCRILRNEITDNQAVTRMESGIAILIASAPASVIEEGNIITVTGDAVLFQAPHLIFNNTQIPLIRDMVNAPNATTVLTAAKLAQGSQIIDIAAGRINVTTSIGTTWRSYTTGTAAPSTGTWKVGDFCWRDAPVGNNPVIGWINIAPGTPGTWTPLTAIDLGLDIVFGGAITMGGTLLMANTKSIQWKDNTGTYHNGIGVYGANQLNIQNPGNQITLVKSDGSTAIAIADDTGFKLPLATASLPLKTNAAKYVVAAKIDLGASADVAGTGLTSGKLPKWNGTNLVDSTSADITLPNVGTAGTYSKVTTDAQGRVTVGATTDLSGADVTGTLAAARLPAFSGDVSSSAGSSVLTLANTGPGFATYTVGARLTPGGTDGTITLDAHGRVIAITQAT